MTTARGPLRADGRTPAVRRQPGPGRPLPLGGPADGVWITEAAAASVLRGAALPGTALGELRIAPDRDAADCGEAPTGPGASPGPGSPTAPDPAGPARAASPAPGPPAPPNAVPPGPLRVGAEFSATPDRPLPETAAALRTALRTAAARLGLDVAAVDLRVTALLEEGAPGRVAAPAEPSAPVAEPDGPVAEAAARVPGVVSLTRVLGAPVHAVGTHLRVEVATAGEHPALDVARSVRTAVTAATEPRRSVSVLVTEVVRADPAAGREAGGTAGPAAPLSR